MNFKMVSVYSNSGSLSEHIGWVRRELLLKKASSGDIFRVLPVLSGLRGDDLQRIVKWLPGSIEVDGESLFKLRFQSCDGFANYYTFFHLY